MTFQKEQNALNELKKSLSTFNTEFREQTTKSLVYGMGLYAVYVIFFSQATLMSLIPAAAIGYVSIFTAWHILKNPKKLSRLSSGDFKKYIFIVLSMFTTINYLYLVFIVQSLWSGLDVALPATGSVMIPQFMVAFGLYKARRDEL